MADRSINISTSESGQTQFTPNPANYSVNDIVSWANRTNEDHQIAVSGVTFTEVIKPFTSSSPAYICQGTGSIPYKCVTPGHTESGTINLVALMLCALLIGIFAPAMMAQTTPPTGTLDCLPI